MVKKTTYPIILYSEQEILYCIESHLFYLALFLPTHDYITPVCAV